MSLRQALRSPSAPRLGRGSGLGESGRTEKTTGCGQDKQLRTIVTAPEAEPSLGARPGPGPCGSGAGQRAAGRGQRPRGAGPVPPPLLRSRRAAAAARPEVGSGRAAWPYARFTPFVSYLLLVV